jgi:hypothetical protein
MWRGGFRLGVSVSGPSVCPCLTSLAMLRFHIPLIKPSVRFSCDGLSDKAVLIFCFTRLPTNNCRYVRWSWCGPRSRVEVSAQVFQAAVADDDGDRTAPFRALEQADGDGEIGPVDTPAKIPSSAARARVMSSAS